jgi:hypothetical protein
MRKRSALLIFWLALMLGLPLQAFAVYAASGCPMGLSHMGMDMPQTDCEGCQANGCALMSFCQNLQTGLAPQIPELGIQVVGFEPRLFDSAFRSFSLDPPERPPRRA